MFHVKRVKNQQQPTNDRYIAFVLPSGQQPMLQLVDLGEAAVVDSLLERFRTAVTGPGIAITAETQIELEASMQQDRGLLQKVLLSLPEALMRDVTGVEESTDEEELRRAGLNLYMHVWNPIAAVLGQIRRIFVSPDGELARLPWSVLPTPNGYLIDHFDISYVSSTSDFMATAITSPQSPDRPLVIADPDFNFGTPDRYDCLPFQRLWSTRLEGKEVSKLLHVTPLLDSASVKAEMTRHMPNGSAPSIIHLATHGFFLPDCRDQAPLWSAEGWHRLAGQHFTNPLLQSGLAFAGVNTWLRRLEPPSNAEDGLLTAEDVARLDLLETELVVLSACETGLGEIQNGEGVFGLGRSFVLAGAKTLVMSLWKVPDRATQELMVGFYERLIRGEGRAEALRQAQLELKKGYRHPRNWGAFICQGDPGPLPEHVLEDIRNSAPGAE